MTNRFLRIFSLFVSFLFVFLFFATQVAHASILFLSPSSDTLTIGSIVPVSVKLDTQGEAINAVSAHIIYPSDLLEVISIESGSAFPITAEQTVGNGVIKITRGSIEQVTGDAVGVATVTFVAKSAGSSAAILTFKPGSAAPRFSNSTDSLDLSKSKGSIFTITQSASLSSQTLGTESTQVTSVPPVVPATNSGVNTNSAITRKTLSLESIVSFVLHLFSF